MTTTDWAAVYAAALDELESVAAKLPAEAIETPVPATPEWTVRQVFAHLAGGSVDAVTGRLDGAPGPEWTARHVGERTEAGVADSMAELRATQAAVAASLEGQDSPALVWDKLVHLADLTEHLALPIPSEATWGPLAAAMRPRLERRAGLALPVDDYTLTRIAFSRRSQAQIAALLPGLDAEQREALGFFGPREDDQPVPASGPDGPA